MLKKLVVFFYTALVVCCLIACGGTTRRLTASPSALICTSRVIVIQQTTRGAYRLEVRLSGTFDHTRFCGQMDTEAHLITPAHGANGELSVFLTNCHDNDLAEQDISVTGGERKGENQTVNTTLISNGCGYASASFIGSSPHSISLEIHTDAINASGSQQWEQWRG